MKSAILDRTESVHRLRLACAALLDFHPLVAASEAAATVSGRENAAPSGTMTWASKSMTNGRRVRPFAFALSPRGGSLLVPDRCFMARPHPASIESKSINRHNLTAEVAPMSDFGRVPRLHRQGLRFRGEVTLTAGDCYVSPGGVPHEVRGWSDDREVLEFTAPADFVTVDAPAA